MTEIFKDAAPEPSELDIYMIGDRSLRDWHHHMTHLEDGTDVGYQRSVPSSRYGSTASDCAWWAIALECAYVNANGGPDDPDAAMEHALGLCVNDHDDPLYIVNEYSYAIPDEVMSHLNLEDLMRPADPDLDDTVPITGFTFTSKRDAVLLALALNGWAAESVGAPDSRLGYTAWMSNAAVELPDLLRVDAAAATAEEVGFTDLAKLLGHLLIDTTDMYVEVTEFGDEDAVRAAFGRVKGLHEDLED